MAVTEPLATIPFADGTHATVSWTLDVPLGTVQSFTWLVPIGHSVTVTARDANGNVLFARTRAGTGVSDTVNVPVGWKVGKAGDLITPGYQINFDGA